MSILILTNFSYICARSIQPRMNSRTPAPLVTTEKGIDSSSTINSTSTQNESIDLNSKFSMDNNVPIVFIEIDENRINQNLKLIPKATQSSEINRPEPVVRGGSLGKC